MLHPQWAVDPTFIERFQREARLLASLEHPNIVWVSDVGEEQGRYYLVERYLPGGSLADRLAKGQLPVEDVPGILLQVCAGLQQLHQRGWVHRDLKPANIMFDAAGQAVITDFGLARAMAASSGSSSSSTGGAGTPFYRAPELWRGKPPVSPATDVYSLGCILGEMLTGKPLFAGDTPDEIITRHLIDGPDFGDAWPPVGVPHALVEMVAKALQRDPAQRYPDAQDFAQALEGNRLADEEAHRKTEEEAARQALPELERARLEAEAQVRRDAEDRVRREREKVKSVEETVLMSQPDTPPVIWAGNKKKIPIWGWLLGVPVLLALLFFAVRDIVELTLAPLEQVTVVVPTAALTAGASVPPDCTSPGQTWVSPLDGMPLVCVPAGKFTMGSNNGDDDEKPVHDVYLDAYWIDQTEVTIGQYEQCFKAGVCTEPDKVSSYTRGSYYMNSQYVDYPVIHVSPYQAADYCNWAGRGVPTEAQWEKAARGTDGRIYPWGNTVPNCTVANHYGCVGDTAAVGSYPEGVSPYGALDMAGNVWEWTANWYGPYPTGEQSNPAGPVNGEFQVMRGGAWGNPVNFLRVSDRYGDKPEPWNYDYFGFRCALSLP